MSSNAEDDGSSDDRWPLSGLPRWPGLPAHLRGLGDAELSHAVPQSRGFYRATVRDGEVVWVPDPTLKPGDKLHDGKLHGVFTHEQHWDLIRACRISNAFRHDALMELLGKVTENYEIYGEFEREEKTLRQHQARLREMAKLAKKLRPLIAEEPLMHRILGESTEYPDDGNPLAHLWRQWQHGLVRAEALCDDLGRIQVIAARLARNETALIKSRLTGADTRKSPERRYIWEPFFQFWLEFGQPLRYSPDGPIMRSLRIIHAGLGIKEPVGTSVQLAINEFKGKLRATKRRRSDLTAPE